MYFLIEHRMTTSRIIQVCATPDLKHSILDTELRRNLVKLVKHKNDMNQDGLYCVQSDTNINRYNIFQCENTPDGYIYKGERLTKQVYDLEFVFYKTDDSNIYKTLLNAELAKYASTITKSLSLAEVRSGRIRSRIKRSCQQSPSHLIIPDITADNYATST